MANRRFGETRLVEHRENAIRQVRHAAHGLLAGDGEGGRVPHEPVPWFWPDQYDRKPQLVGLTVGHDEVRVVDGDPSDGRFVALYHRGDEVTAAFGVNRARGISTTWPHRKSIALGRRHVPRRRCERSAR